MPAVDAELDLDAEVPESDGGELVVLDAGPVPVPSGELVPTTAGDAAAGTGFQRVQLAPGPVTGRLLVSRLVGPDPSRGQPAFVELVLPGGPAMAYGRVGGTTDDVTGEHLGSGLVVAGAPELQSAFEEVQEGMQPEAYAYHDVLYATSSGGCALRRDPSGAVDAAMLTHTQFGDDGVYAGRDATGTVVSVVVHGGVAPWALSGLPGALPPDSDRRSGTAPVGNGLSEHADTRAAAGTYSVPLTRCQGCLAPRRPSISVRLYPLASTTSCTCCAGE